MKALLFGDGLARHQNELKEANDSETFSIWRQQHAIGKLHNVVKYIMRSPQRIQAFNVAQYEVIEELESFGLRLLKDTGVQ